MTDSLQTLLQRTRLLNGDSLENLIFQDIIRYSFHISMTNKAAMKTFGLDAFHLGQSFH